MALSLQDLLVGFDASAPQAPRANAPAPRGTPAQDPFAALVAAPSNSPTTNSAPAPRSTQSSARSDDVSRPPRSANAKPSQDSQSDTSSAKSSDTSTDKTDTSARSSDRKTTRADDKASKSSDTGTDKTDDSSTDKADSKDTATTATPAGVAPVVVDVVQVAQLANAQTDTGDASTAPVGAATAPGTNANVVADVVTQGSTKADDKAQASSNSANPLADAPKGNADATALFAAFTAPGQNDKAADPTAAKIVATASSTDTAATAPTDPTATAPTDPKSAQTANANSGPAPQASPVAQVATQAPRDPGATSDAVREVVRPNGTVPASQTAATVQVVAQTTRPADITGKPATPRTDAANKSNNATTKSASDDANTPTGQSKDTQTANAVAPAAPAKDATPIATVVTTPAPTVDGDDATAPTQNASTATPIAAPVAGGSQQAHQLYAKTAANAPALPQATVDQVVAHVSKAADDGVDQLTIQLKPAHLGAIEVKLEMHDDGGLAKATISADRPDTLDLLQRDSHRLERALENAGIKADAGSLSFNLRGDGGRQQQPTFAQQNNNAAPSRPSYTSDDTGVDTSVIAYLNARTARGGVDIRV